MQLNLVAVVAKRAENCRINAVFNVDYVER